MDNTAIVFTPEKVEKLTEGILEGVNERIDQAITKRMDKTLSEIENALKEI